ncbi:GNAT family N-acetyltransferase [Sphingomonas sp.]|uniref:GNAT family N-acetyltransferase n=1 Tax=Sphingomonas sp. TaxID=28214 RepID=UPI002CDFE448|nr:GNAT family N-acetyltransferase [Sphingomonas sp.]HWK34714.1 GNAT family N-acetyltransferase [Sphingomonas sp.]
MIVIETDRLILRHLTVDDAPFLHALLTDADFLAQIGDRGVHTLADARRAIPERYVASYDTHGFGMFAVVERGGAEPIGMAGLVARDWLDHVDLGYAFLPAGRGKGYALEAARAVLDWAGARGIAPVAAIVKPRNARSVAILGRLGMGPHGTVLAPGVAEPLLLFRTDS